MVGKVAVAAPATTYVAEGGHVLATGAHRPLKVVTLLMGAPTTEVAAAYPARPLVAKLAVFLEDAAAKVQEPPAP